MTETQVRQPAAKFRAGGVTATVWRNSITREGREVEVFSISVDRAFKQGDEFRHTSSFGANDLPKVQLVVSKAYEFVTLKSDRSP